MDDKNINDIPVTDGEQKLIEQVDVLKKQISKMEKKINSLIAKKTIKASKEVAKESAEESFVASNETENDNFIKNEEVEVSSPVQEFDSFEDTIVESKDEVAFEEIDNSVEDNNIPNGETNDTKRQEYDDFVNSFNIEDDETVEEKPEEESEEDTEEETQQGLSWKSFEGIGLNDTKEEEALENVENNSNEIATDEELEEVSDAPFEVPSFDGFGFAEEAKTTKDEPVENEPVESKMESVVEPEEPLKKPEEFEMPKFDIPTEEITESSPKKEKPSTEEDKKAKYRAFVDGWSTIQGSTSKPASTEQVEENVEKPIEKKDDFDYFKADATKQTKPVDDYVTKESPKPSDVQGIDTPDFDSVNFEAPVFDSPKDEEEIIASMNSEERKAYFRRRAEEQKNAKARLQKEKKEIQITRKRDAKFSGKSKHNPVARILIILLVIILVLAVMLVTYGTLGVCDVLPRETEIFGLFSVDLHGFYVWLFEDKINSLCNKMGFDIIEDFFNRIKDLLGQ